MESVALTSALTQQVATIISTVNEHFTGLDEVSLNWKESADRWSILECIEHLNRYCRFYNPHIMIEVDAVLIQAHKPLPVKSTWIGKKFIAMMHPDNTKKQKTFSRMNPVNSTLDKSVLTEFLKHQNDLLDILRNVSHTNLNEGKVPVEFFNVLKLNIGDALQFVIVHEQRHVNQAMAMLPKLKRFKPALVI